MIIGGARAAAVNRRVRRPVALVPAHRGADSRLGACRHPQFKRLNAVAMGALFLLTVVLSTTVFGAGAAQGAAGDG
jgi:hypothetical protein